MFSNFVIKNDNILCLHIYEENLNADGYMAILNNVLEDDADNLSINEIAAAWYQYAWAAHNGAAVADSLEEMFDANGWQHNGPPRSSNLTPMDFFHSGLYQEHSYFYLLVPWLVRRRFYKS